ncbi:MAG: hypothetical protein AB8B73_11000 [Ekhidna sp.]
MLQENEIEVKVNYPFVTFKKVSVSNAVLIIPAFLLSLIAVVHIQQHPLKTLAVIIIIALITKALWLRLTKKLHFQIDSSDHTFKFYDQHKNLHWHFLNEVIEIGWKSRFISEYSNDFKSTNEEYEISILLRTNKNKVLPVFQFQSGYAEPGPEFLEIYSFLENSIKNIKII